MASQIVTANRLLDGRVVFLTAAQGWSEDVDDSAVAAGDAEAARLLALAERAAADRVVVAPYLIEVEVDGARVTPRRYRERIRALGPSTHPEFGRAAAVAG